MFGNGKSSNPVLQDKTFRKETAFTSGKVMTVNGTIEKTGILLFVLIIAASYTWKIFFNSGDPENAMSTMTPWMIGGALGGFAVAIAMIFMKKYAAYLAPIYAILEGLFLGALSAMFESQYQGIVMNAVLATFATFLFMLFAYRTGLIKVTEKLKSIVFATTGSVAVMYLMSWILGMFGVDMSLMHGSGLMSIGISVVVIVIAAFNLLLDFDFIEKGSAMGAPKYMEWFSAFGLLVTLVWLYIEFLRLFAKLQGRD
jgi:uncharacterized YccA/Bax inhibitor family protein